MLYVLCNYVLLRVFAGDGGYAGERRILRAAFRKSELETRGEIWWGTLSGRISSLIMAVGFVGSGLGGLLASHGRVLSRSAEGSVLIMVLVIVVILIHRRREMK